VAPYKTILVTTDFSEPSVAALREASALAEAMGSRLILAYVVEDRLPPMILAASSEPTDKILEEHRRHAKASLASFAAEHLPGREVDTRVLEGVAWESIVLYAKNEEVDLLVMGMHGHGFVGHLLTGSTTERVLHQAPCPVLVCQHE
jgi:nucleotide-binding universal stress UspA family protein